MATAPQTQVYRDRNIVPLLQHLAGLQYGLDDDTTRRTLVLLCCVLKDGTHLLCSMPGRPHHVLDAFNGVFVFHVASFQAMCVLLGLA